MNEKASCMESLVINFAPSIITVLIVFSLKGHVSKLAKSKFDILTGKRTLWGRTCTHQEVLNAGLQLNGFDMRKEKKSQS